MRFIRLCSQRMYATDVKTYPGVADFIMYVPAGQAGHEPVSERTP
jgi:hypothetical protein